MSTLAKNCVKLQEAAVLLGPSYSLRRRDGKNLPNGGPNFDGRFFLFMRIERTFTHIEHEPCGETLAQMFSHDLSSKREDL